jgi:hypothetical protein
MNEIKELLKAAEDILEYLFNNGLYEPNDETFNNLETAIAHVRATYEV